MGILRDVAVSVIPGVLGNYLYDKLPFVAKYIVKITASTISGVSSERWKDQWMADLYEQDTNLDMLFCAVGCIRAVRHIDGFAEDFVDAAIGYVLFPRLTHSMKECTEGVKNLSNHLRSRDFKDDSDAFIQAAELADCLAVHTKTAIERAQSWKVNKKINCINRYLEELIEYQPKIEKLGNTIRSMKTEVDKSRDTLSKAQLDYKIALEKQKTIREKRHESLLVLERQVAEIDTLAVKENYALKRPNYATKREELQRLIDKARSSLN